MIYKDSIEKKLFYGVLAVLIFKLLAAWLLPLTGDEAYFITWGKSLESGYYDHPPLTGWIVYFLAKIVDSYVFFRLFVVAIGLGCGWLIYRTAKEFYPDNALKCAYIFLISPVHLFFLLYSNDSLVCFFSLGGALLLYLGLKRDSLLTSVLAGFVFGFAYMSKYLAFPIFLSLFIYVCLTKDRRRFMHFLLFSLMIVPFFAQNMYYNYTHCWNNIMFNLINRTAGSDNIASSILHLFGNLAYISLPWVLYFMYRSRAEIRKQLFPLVLFASCFIFYILLSARRSIDLHWLLILAPYVFVMIGAFSREHIEKTVKYTTIFMIIHLVLGVAVLGFPVDVLKKKKVYKTIAAVKYADELCPQFDEYPDAMLVTKSYALSSLMDTLCKREAHVMFSVSKHGRQDDTSFNIRALEGKNILFFHRHKFTQQEDDIATFFEKSEVKRIEVRGIEFFLIYGQGFKYEPYRDDYLRKVNNQFYQFPSWLKPKRCLFRELYFGGECSPSEDNTAP